MLQKTKIAAIVGPTAVGKTALSISLAERFGGEIISCDSMQIYRYMDIGTAKPTLAEREGIPHHMMDIITPDKDFSCTDYSSLAAEKVKDVVGRGKIPIFCGGTGLYLDSVIRGVRDDSAYEDPAFREKMQDIAAGEGNEHLHAMLREIDPISADAIHPNNVKRVIRALEVYHTSGKTKTELDEISVSRESEYEPLIIGLRCDDRDLLYERINLRVDIMIRDGLLDEVKALLDMGYLDSKTTAGQAIGYKELVGYFRGDKSLDDAIEEIKMSSRRYAKRQMTWFNSKKNVKWISIDDDHQIKTFEEIVNNGEKLFENFFFCDII